VTPPGERRWRFFRLPYCDAFATFRVHFLSILFLYRFIIDVLPLSHLIAAQTAAASPSRAAMARTVNKNKKVKSVHMNRLIAAMFLGVPVALTLPGCVTMSENVTGSEIGGTIPMAGITRQQAAEMARAHCAQYGRSSRILAIRPEDGVRARSIRSEDGVKAIFECT
jgi:hypothetical protein